MLGVLQARCQTSRAGGAAPGGPTAEELRVVRETSTRHQEATVSACCTTPCVFGFNTGASAKGVGSAGRAPRCEGAPLMRGVDGVETLRDALASEKAEARRDVNLPRGWLGPDAGLGCRAEERRGHSTKKNGAKAIHASAPFVASFQPTLLGRRGRLTRRPDYPACAWCPPS